MSLIGILITMYKTKKNVKDHKKEIYINTYEFLFMEFFRYWLLPLKPAQY